MTIKRQKIVSGQGSLFDILRETVDNGNTRHKGSLDITTEFKEALSEDLRYAHDEQGREISRAQVAARMTDYLGQEVSLSTINNWTAQSHPHELPGKWLPAWVHATNGRLAAQVISKHSGLFMLPGPEAIRAEIRKRDEIMETTRKEKQEWVVLLKKLEGR